MRTDKLIAEYRQREEAESLRRLWAADAQKARLKRVRVTLVIIAVALFAYAFGRVYLAASALEFDLGTDQHQDR